MGQKTQTLTIRTGSGASAVHDRHLSGFYVNIPSPPWGDMEPTDRAETAPRRRGLIVQPRKEHPAVAAIRAEWAAMRREAAE